MCPADDIAQFEVRLDPDGASLRVLVSGELDIATAPELAMHLGADDSLATLELDLTGVTFIDSTGLRVLFDAYQSIGGRLRIVPSPACERLFELAGVSDRLPLVKA